MSVSLPLTKDILKKMFVKVLYEHTAEDGLYKHLSSDYTFILRETMVEFFNISYLTEEEFEEGARAVKDLERFGYIQTDLDGENDDHKELTENGRRVALRGMDEINLPNVNIDSILTRYDLREVSLDEFLKGSYDSAIQNAFILLEGKIRENIMRPSILLENDKISSFYVTAEGAIKENKNSEMSKKLKTLHFKLIGDIMWYKSAADTQSEEEKAVIAAQILSFVNLHLKLVDQCAHIM